MYYYLMTLNCSWSKAGHKEIEFELQFITMLGIVNTNVYFV